MSAQNTEKKWNNETLYIKKLHTEAGLDGRMLYNAGVFLSKERLLEIIESSKASAPKQNLVDKIKLKINSKLRKAKFFNTEFSIKEWFLNLRLVRIYKKFDQLDNKVNDIESVIYSFDSKIKDIKKTATHAKEQVYKVYDPSDKMVLAFVNRLRLVKDKEDGPLVIRALTKEQFDNEQKETREDKIKAAETGKTPYTKHAPDVKIPNNEHTHWKTHRLEMGSSFE